MNVKILYDNEAKEGFQCGWGFAALVDGTTLFDTGEDAVSLAANMKAFGLDPGRIENVVISHEDWDHAGGIAILRQLGAVKVYLPAGSPDSMKSDITGLNPNASIVEVLNETAIGSDKFVIRTLGTGKKEISLIVCTEKGVVVVTGCAHPGLDRIMESALWFGRVRAVVGGFHGFSRLEALSEVDMIFPCHCTENRRGIMDMYPDKTHFIAAGADLRIGCGISQ